MTKRLGPPEASTMGDWRCSLRSADQPPDPYHHYDDDDHEGEADVVRHPEGHVVWHVAIAPSLIGSTQPEVTARKQSHVVHPARLGSGRSSMDLNKRRPMHAASGTAP